MDRSLFLLTALRFVAQVHAQVPVHHWPLDEQTGTLANDVAGGEHAMLYNNTTWQPTGGHHAGAVLLSGNDARLVTGPCDITTGTGAALSIACWFKPVIVSGTERVLIAKSLGTTDQDHVWSLSLVNNTGARFRVRAAGVVHTLEVPPSSIFSNAWYHLAGTYDGSQMRLYLNGSLIASAPAAGSIGFYPQAPACLGNLVNAPRPFYGALDDVRLYDEALSAQAVVDLVIGNVATSVPAPTNDRVMLIDGALVLPSGNWDHIVLYDLQGRTILTEPYCSAPIRPATGSLPTGTYLVCLQGGPTRHVSRVYLP